MATRYFLLCFLAYSYIEGKRTDNDEGLSKNAHETCGTSQNHRTRRHAYEVFPRRPPMGNKFVNALEFSGGQVIRYRKVRNPSMKFAVDFWMKPEGGQHNPAIVIRAFDKCAPEHEKSGWFIGLREASVKSDLRVAFTLHAVSKPRPTTLMSHKKIEAGRWLHVAATYDGRRMELYLNQAKVATSYGQKGLIFDSVTQGQNCDLLEMGGDAKNGSYYRGQIDKLRLWSEAITHKEISASIPDNTVEHLTDKLLMYDEFDDEKTLMGNWIASNYPRVVRSTVPEEKHDLSIRKPPCGVTICDNAEIIRSYLKHTTIRGHKKLRIRFVNVMEDDGKRPTVTDSEIHAQFQLIQNVFARYNITWQLEVVAINNTRLRWTTVLHNCETDEVGDNNCNEHCLYDINGYDGGDCITRPKKCEREKQGNKECDPECNTGFYNWDYGDCCLGNTNTGTNTCFDPTSPNRVYMSVKEYREKIDLDNRDAVNVHIVNWRDKDLQGIGTFPWEKAVHTVNGGVIMPPMHFRKTNISKVLVHELGHVLGLWHVHHGVSELKCREDCFESFPSLELGDMCSDTNPTILSRECRDPDPDKTKCGAPHYTNTPFNNYMSYADDACTDHFTPQQVARMHCYINLDYQSWQTDLKPSFIPLPPRITSATKNTIQLAWIPPLASGGNNAKNLCNECEEDKVLEQYASTASSPMSSKPDGNSAPHQAIGPPDAKECDSSALAWQPYTYENENTCTNCPLYLEVGFKEAVVPTSITIWNTGGAHEPFSDIQLIFTDNTSQSIGNGTVQCDSPFTKPLYDVRKKVSKVRINVSSYNVLIDAVKLTSEVEHPNCSQCEPLEYIIHRNPPFDTGPEVRVSTTRYEDKNIYKNDQYEYRVRAVTDEGLLGPFSPPLIYKPQKGFCGDGKIDKVTGEECDDGNVRDGDGCNVQCQMEDVFHCDGRPSLCYKHDGDGVCEEFEKQTSIKDCGFYTPEGFEDQWIDRAEANPKYRDDYTCHESIIEGPPRPDQICQPAYPYTDICENGWCPDLFDYNGQDMWLKVYFKQPAIASAIIVYLGFVGTATSIKFELTGSSKHEKTTIKYRLEKFCKENPITLPISHDMTKPFYKTQYIKVSFSSADSAGIAAIALRSRSNFDPIALQGCQSTELFHPRTQKCHQYKCNIPVCARLNVDHANKVQFKKGKPREGDVCTVECRKGFTPVKPFQAICLDGKWLVDGEPPLCTPVDCRNPAIQYAQIDCLDGTTYGKKCFYKCIDATKKSGSSVTCEEDGSWSATDLICRKTCHPPATPLNALPLTPNCNRGKAFGTGEKCDYRCKNGFVLNSGLPQKSRFHITCLNDGTWSASRCLPVRCPIPDMSTFRWYNCSFGANFGSVCALACPNSKNNRKIRCLADGQWDKTFKLCLTKGTCAFPKNVAKGLAIKCNKDKGYIPNDECEVKCEEGFEPGIKQVILQSPRQRFDAIACSPMFRWYPDPSRIKCLVKCNFNDLEDGFCQGINNNEDCEWDRGDCCDPDAMKSASLCGNNCGCLDPNQNFESSGSPI